MPTILKVIGVIGLSIGSYGWIIGYIEEHNIIIEICQDIGIITIIIFSIYVIYMCMKIKGVI